MGLLANANKNDDKPLFRNWVKSANHPYDLIIAIRLSRSEEWIIIEGQESLAFLNAESKVGKEFWGQVQNFSGKSKGLTLVPAKGKLGYDVEVTDLYTGYWSVDETNTFWFDDKPRGSNLGITSNLWEKMSPEKWREIADEQEQEIRASNNPSNTRKKKTKEEETQASLVNALGDD